MDKCRLCYTKPDPEMYQHIFNTQSEPPIWKIIEQLSNLIITKNDPYTKNICGQCFNNLVKYSDFRRQILDTDYRIQHEKVQLLEKRSDNCDYFEEHCTPTRSDNDDFMIKEEEIEIVEDPLKIGDESNEELNNSSLAVMRNQDTKEFVIVDKYNHNDKIKACYTSPNDNSNETNERQSSKCSTDEKIDFNRDSSKTDGSYTISTNNNDLSLNSNADIIASDENERSTTKNVRLRKKYIESTKGCKTARCDLTMNLIHNRKTEQNHAEMQTHERPLKSNIYNKESLDEANLSRHKQVHTDKKSYRCNICNKQFLNKSNLNIHERIHTGEKPFKCNICNKHFSQKHNLLGHKRVHTGEKPFKCKICNKQFLYKTSVLIHERIHTGEKPFKCSICKKEFLQKSNLLRHEQVHTNKKPYKCNICDKSFSTRQELKEHLNIHTGQKPYCCDICGKTFSFRSALHIHLKLHKDEKEFKCDVCNKQFVQKYRLDIHLRKHTGEKPFKCDACNKAFRNSDSLRIHSRRTHVVEKS